MAKTKSPQEFTFKVVGDGSRYTQVLYHSQTKRATAELLSYRLPYGSTIELWREGQKITTATVDFEGYSGHGGDLQEVFMGESFALIEPEAMLMQSDHLPQQGKLYSQKIRASSLVRGDKIVLTIKREHMVPYGREKWSYERWFRYATQKNRRAAREVEYEKASAMVIHRLFDRAHPGDLGTAQRDFREVRMGTQWLELLYDAVQQVGIPKPKEQTRDEISKRLQSSIKRTVKLVMKNGERLKGNLIEFDPDRDNVKLQTGEFTDRLVSFNDIRRVI